MADVISNERHFGAKLASDQTCSPGTPMYIDSSGEANFADGYTNMAHGIALTSGSGTKTPGYSQYVRLDRQARIVSSGWTWTIGNPIYLTGSAVEWGYTDSVVNQKVGFALDVDEVYVDLDMQLGV